MLSIHGDVESECLITGPLPYRRAANHWNGEPPPSSTLPGWSVHGRSSITQVNVLLYRIEVLRALKYLSEMGTKLRNLSSYCS